MTWDEVLTPSYIISRWPNPITTSTQCQLVTRTPLTLAYSEGLQCQLRRQVSWNIYYPRSKLHHLDMWIVSTTSKDALGWKKWRHVNELTLNLEELMLRKRSLSLVSDANKTKKTLVLYTGPCLWAGTSRWSVTLLTLRVLNLAD